MARDLLHAEGASASIRVSDFFAIEPTGSYDAVIGNPPYVRYQDFSGESRARSRQAALRAGVPLTNLASSWAADRLLVPSPALITAAAGALAGIRPQIATHLRHGRLLEAARLVDTVLLAGELGLSRSAIRALREGHAELTARRVARGSSPRGPDR
jgi:hypothetical protein